MDSASEYLNFLTATYARQQAAHWDPLAAELLRGLTGPRKSINPKFLYDEKGSQLFDRITTLPEYYPTRTENSILNNNASDIAQCVGPKTVLIEPGAGSCAKVRHLLNDIHPVAYLPQDISADFLYQTTVELKGLYPWLDVQPLVGDFSDAIDLPEDLPDARRVVFYPGSTIGNFEPGEAANFLRDMRQLVGDDGGMIVGVDLQKDTSILNAAYNDSAGVTAAFNRNILHHTNRILGTKIDVDGFVHHAFYNEAKHRIEMHLLCTRDQRVDYEGGVLRFSKGETIHTESSYKYTEESFARLAHKAGFELKKTWLDKDGLFSVHYLA